MIKEPAEESVEELRQDSAEKLVEEPTENKIENFIEEHKKILIGIVISFCILLIIYFGLAKHFTNHFYIGTEINAINVSGKTVEDANIIMTSALQNYTLNLKARGGRSGQIKGSDIGLKYCSDEEFKKLKDRQDPFMWILAPFFGKQNKIEVEISYDEKRLKEQIDKLTFFNNKNIIEPKNPSFKYTNNHYVIVDEVLGNKVDKDILYCRVADSILKRESELDLDSKDCYINPQYNSKSQKMIDVKDTLNKYASTKVTYVFGDTQETLDGSVINKWLTVDNNFRIIIDEEKVKDYINELAKNHDTIGKIRKFVAALGKNINIGGGDYGWSINKAKETDVLIEIIREGKTITKDPAYSQTASSHDINDFGNTYVEIDIVNQHLWFYKKGLLIVEGDVVTGNVKAKHATPRGIYRLKYKARDVILRGPGYAAPVDYWMPFNGGIGIHDASWRSAFGGNIYKTNGSHGCINLSYKTAKKMYNNIKVNTPVICY